jgi:pyruvate dehydrogenase E2 component (dihydrolipoamide acetyltransferase)
MSRLLTLPRMGETMESGRIVGWLKQPGERFRRGETIVEIESDKTVVELPALADGLLLEVLAEVGADVAVGAPLCRYEVGDGVAVEQSQAPSQPRPEPLASEAPAAVETTKLRATPVARRLARESGVDLAGVTGSGRRGRIEAGDIRAASATPRARTALLLHGFGGDAQTWAGLRALFERKGVAVSTPDLPGHGASGFEAREFAELVEPLGALLEKSEPLELVGHSLGGAVAVALARAHPGRVARLTLLAPLGLDSAVDADFILGLAAVRSVGGLSHLLRRLSPRPLALSSAQLAQMAAEFGRGRLVALAQSLVAGGGQQIDILPDLAALRIPVRVVWGLEDRILPWTQAAHLPSRVAIHLIAGAGHMPHWDFPQLVAELFDP